MQNKYIYVIYIVRFEQSSNWGQAFKNGNFGLCLLHFSRIFRALCTHYLKKKLILNISSKGGDLNVILKVETIAILNLIFYTTVCLKCKIG